MGILRRPKREVYRVYSEEEFLSDPGALSDWCVSPAARVSRERPLRRLAGIVALTGAVGTVVGAIALAGVGSRSAGPRVTASAAQRPAAERPATARTAPALLAGAHRNRLPRASRGALPHGVHARAARSATAHRPARYRPALRRRGNQSRARRPQLPSGTAVTVRLESVVSAQATARAPVRSEFGFER
jgi:hypothetical protein